MFLRTIRRVEAAWAVAIVAGTAIFFYEFGFAAHPHRLGLACIVAAAYLVWSGAGFWAMHRIWMRRLRNM